MRNFVRCGRNRAELIEGVTVTVLAASVVSIVTVLKLWRWLSFFVGELQRLTDTTAAEHHQMEYYMGGTRESVSSKQLPLGDDCVWDCFMSSRHDRAHTLPILVGGRESFVSVADSKQRVRLVIGGARTMDVRVHWPQQGRSVWCG